jgi:tetratricopeptide (TPR) repeat protein
MHASSDRSDFIKRLSIVTLKRTLLILVVVFTGNGYSQTPQEQTTVTISDYLIAIDSLEANQGAYSAELSDLFMGLGNSYVIQQEYDDANLAFQRGMQIERINFGLDSLSQSAYLMSIAETEKLMGDLDQAQTVLDQLYSLNAKSYGQSDVRMLPVIESLMDWHTQVYPLRKPKGGFHTLIALEDLANDMYKILDAEVSLKDPATPDRYKRIGKVQFLIANHIKHYGEARDSSFSVAVEGSSGARTEPRTSYKHFKRGKAALQRVIESLMQQQPSIIAEQAVAIANLGDWYLVFGQITSATKTYQLAEEIVDTTDNPDQLRTLLFQEAAVIDFSDGVEQAVRQEATAGAGAAEPLQISMQISKSGFASDFQIVDDKATLTRDQLKVLQQHFRKKRFRPFFSDGDTQTMRFNKSYDLVSTGV